MHRNLIVIALLQSVPIFAGLNEKALNVLLKHAKAKEYPENEVIVHEGETCCILFVIASGSVRLFQNFGKADQVELATLYSKDFFGESCILDTLPRLATVQAASPTTVFNISSRAFYRLYQNMPSQHSILLMNIARDLSRRLRVLDKTFAARH